MSIQNLVKSKVDTMRQRVQAAGGDFEQASIIHNDYSLYFQGASEALAASGVEQDQAKPVDLALAMVEAEMAALASKNAFEQAVG